MPLNTLVCLSWQGATPILCPTFAYCHQFCSRCRCTTIRYNILHGIVAYLMISSLLLVNSMYVNGSSSLLNSKRFNLGLCRSIPVIFSIIIKNCISLLVLFHTEVAYAKICRSKGCACMHTLLLDFHLLWMYTCSEDLIGTKVLLWAMNNNLISYYNCWRSGCNTVTIYTCLSSAQDTISPP